MVVMNPVMTPPRSLASEEVGLFHVMQGVMSVTLYDKETEEAVFDINLWNVLQ